MVNDMFKKLFNKKYKWHLVYGKPQVGRILDY